MICPDWTKVTRMAQGDTSQKQSPFERRIGFFRRNWIVLALALPALLVLLVAFAWWWWLPAYVDGAVRDMEGTVARIMGTEVTHSKVTLEGLDRLHVEGLRIGAESSPLCTLATLVVEVDPFTLSEGLPTVLQVVANDVDVRIVARADGSDNLRPVLASIRAYLDRDRSGGGEASRLARLLRQTPALQLNGITVSLIQESQTGSDKLLTLAGGTVRAENPNVSLRNRAYLLDATFLEANGKSRLTLQADLDIDRRQAQLQAEFKPGMYFAWRGQEVAVEEFRFRSGEFVELSLGRTSLTNPLEDAALLNQLLASFGNGKTLLALSGGLLDGLAQRRSQVARLVGVVEPRLVALGYAPELLTRFVKATERFTTRLLQRLLSEAEGEHLVLDSVKMVYLISQTRSGAAQEKIKLTVKAGGAGGGEIAVVRRPADDYLEATFDLVSPSRVFQIAGEFEKDADNLSGRADLTASLLDPFFQVKGSATYRNGELEGDVRAQVKAEQPPLALAIDGTMRNGKVEGTLDGELLLASLVHLKQARLSYHGEKWEADLTGDLFPPAGFGPVGFKAALDSTSGIRRFSAAGEGDLRVPLGDYDLLLNKLRLGRDAVVHLEDIALARRGGDRSRATVRIADLAIHLSQSGKELLETVAGLDFDMKLDGLLAKLVSSVEVVQPTIELRQPPRLVMNDADDAPDRTDDLADKIDDALEEGGNEAVVMVESYRKGLEAIVLTTGTSVRGFVTAMLKLGDRFPLEEVKIKEGRFEYSDAVLERDRLITELSNFNARIAKVQRPGNLGGKFTISADFSTAVANDQAGSTLTAEVDLATGDLRGQFTVEKMALHPYRFLLPQMLQAHQKTFLEDALLGFAYATESDRFRVWGHGRFSDFNIIAGRIARKPLDHLSLEFMLGDDVSNGLVFELERKRVATNSPIYFTYGKLKGITASFAIEAAVPDYPKFELELRIPDAPVNDLFASIPKALGEQLNGMQVGGTLGLTLAVAADSKNLRDMSFRVTPNETDIRLEVPGTEVDFNKLAGPFKHRPPTDKNRVVRIGGGPDFVPLSRISPWLVLAVTTTEDGSFFRHEGFNTYQVKMSVVRNLEKGRFVRGASTITMQLVKNLFLSHEKTLARKFQEIILTWLIEREITKEKLIEIYLNVIEWGDGVYGIKEACDHYFDGLPPDNLSPAQAAFLVSFIPYPRPFYARFNEGMKGKERSKRWLRWWGRRQKLVKRIVRAMVNNCQQLRSKCPSSVDYCQVLQATCNDPGRELIAADNVTDLDEIFRPRDLPVEDPMLGSGTLDEL